MAMSSRKINFVNENLLRFPPKTRHVKKKIFNFILTRVGLLCTVCLYLLAGAFLFQCLESKHELKQQGLVQQQKINCLKELWIITGIVLPCFFASCGEWISWKFFRKGGGLKGYEVLVLGFH